MSTSPKSKLETLLQPLRDSIDTIDSQILDLINQRARIAQEVGEIKNKEAAQIYDEQREHRLLSKLQQINEGPLSGGSVNSIYRAIIKACRRLEHESDVVEIVTDENVDLLKSHELVAFLGPEGTFSHQAAQSYFDSSIEVLPCSSFGLVADAVVAGEAAVGVLPVENTVGGFVGTPYDLVFDHHLHVVGEVITPIKLNLVANCERQEIQTIYSHVQPLRQAQQWLSKNTPNAKLVEVESTIEGARRAEQEPGSGAIVAPLGLELTSLQLLDANIADEAGNCTRFWIVSKEPLPHGNKSALMLLLPHVPGSLAATLSDFSDHDVNLSQIVSRPAPEKDWEYRFFIEMEADTNSRMMQLIFRYLTDEGVIIHPMGAFEKADQKAGHP